MRLRPRLALTTGLVSLPMVVGLVFWDARSRRAAAEEELEELARGLVASPGWIDSCEASPATWRGERPGPLGGPPPPGPPPAMPGPPVRHSRPAVFFGYGDDLRSPNPDAPALPPSVSMGDRDALPFATSRSTVRVLVRVPGEPRACAYVLAEGTTEPWLGGILPATHIWLLPLVAVVAAVLLVVGPMVRRLRRLTAAARRSAESEFQSGVPMGGDDEVAELALAFDGAARTVRAQLAETRRREEALREFLASTTHDIMIPLTVLQGRLAELRQLAGAGDAVGHAMDEAHYLGSLLHNLAIAARLDAAGAALQQGPVDLGALVERVVSRHRPIARGLDVALDRAVPAAPLLVRADVTLLEQAVGNLVYNAVRHNRPGGHVAVILERGAACGFVLGVLDDGPGVPDEELARLVERGFRGNDARTRGVEGHGIGLAIAHRVALLHGFRLAFRRSEYGGLHAELSGADQDAS